MDPHEYMMLAQRTSNTRTPYDKILNGCIGLIGETGEVADIVKKRFYQGMDKETASVKLFEETGDVLWYIAELCFGMGEEVPEPDDGLIGMDTDDGKRPELARLVVMMSHQSNKIAEAVMCENNLPEIKDKPMMMYRIKMLLTMCNMLLRWYCGKSMDDAAVANIEKLKARYPNGFSSRKSNERYA